MSEIKIRAARPDDAARLAQAEKAHALTPGQLVSAPEEVKEANFREKIQELAGSKGGLYVVAECAEGGPLGHLLLEPMALQRLKHIVRLTVVVHPGHQRQGVGRKLMEYAVEWARNHDGVDKIELLVRETNSGAIALYKSLGFVEEGRLRRRLKLGPGQYLDDLTMGLIF